MSAPALVHIYTCFTIQGSVDVFIDMTAHFGISSMLVIKIHISECSRPIVEL